MSDETRPALDLENLNPLWQHVPEVLAIIDEVRALRADVLRERDMAIKWNDGVYAHSKKVMAENARLRAALVATPSVVARHLRAHGSTWSDPDAVLALERAAEDVADSGLDEFYESVGLVQPSALAEKEPT